MSSELRQTYILTRRLHCRKALKQEQAQAAQAQAAQKAEAEAAMQRHLDLIDRLLADKDTLAGQVDEQKQAASDSDSKHLSAIDALKKGWAVELRKQKEAWAAAEKVRACQHCVQTSGPVCTVCTGLILAKELAHLPNTVLVHRIGNCSQQNYCVSDDTIQGSWQWALRA